MDTTNQELQLALQFQAEILKKVSRSFALTIPQLPEQLQIPIANGYLLCRITDTIEDEASLSIQQKSYFHKQFIETLIGNYQIQQFIDELSPLIADTKGTSKYEKLLILNLKQVLYITNSLPIDTKISLKKCVTIMNQGMKEFEQIISIHGLDNLLDLEKYCYIVAGVVGEMLTELFGKYLNLPLECQNQLMPLARSFGQALQMTNILKDRWSDFSRNICFLPKDLFESINFSELPKKITEPDFKDNIIKLININFIHLENALNYVLLIPKQQIGIRKFCLWAIGMAIDLLKNIKKNPGFSDVSQIKISKMKLKIIIFTTNTIIKFNYLLKIWFKCVTVTLKPKIV